MGCEHVSSSGVHPTLVLQALALLFGSTDPPGNPMRAGGAVAAVLRPGGGLGWRTAGVRAAELPGWRHVCHAGRHGRLLFHGALFALGPAGHLVGWAPRPSLPFPSPLHAYHSDKY